MREVALLTEIGAVLPLAVPAYELIGQPTKDWPVPFAGYRKIPGVSGEECRPEPQHRAAIAAQLGEFLSCLHTFPVAKARGHGIPRQRIETAGPEQPVASAQELLARIAQRGPVIRSRVPNLTDEMDAFLTGRLELPPARPRSSVLCHADLKGEHVILSDSGNAVAGVIDWTDCTLTDPVLDFTGLMIWLGEEFVRAALSHYGRAVDDGFLQRVCFYARCFALDNIALSAGPRELLLDQLRWAFAG